MHGVQSDPKELTWLQEKTGATNEVMLWLWAPLSPQEIINKEITAAKHSVWINNDTLSSLTA